jgi:hypothetical protein
MKLSSRLERYLEWLERELIPEYAKETIGRLQAYLREELRRGWPMPTPLTRNQINALLHAGRAEIRAWREWQIRAVVPKIAGTQTPRYLYKQIRYLIPGKPGLWGYDAVRKYLEG